MLFFFFMSKTKQLSYHNSELVENEKLHRDVTEKLQRGQI